MAREKGGGPATDATRQFRESLGPMSGALYDERLYGALD